MIVRASSGSKSCSSSVEPLISANSAVTVLRSPSTAPASVATSPIRTDGAAFTSDAESGAVHCPQNLKPGGFSERHLGQTKASGAVHWPQNFILSGFSKPHFEQRIKSLGSPATGLRAVTRRGPLLLPKAPAPRLGKCRIATATASRVDPVAGSPAPHVRSSPHR